MSAHLNERLSSIFGRRSIRKYQETPIPDAIVADLLAAAMAAPSACAKDPWRFVVIRDRATLQRLAGVLPHGKLLAQAPLGIVVCGDLEAAHDGQLSYLLQDCSASIQNLLLAAHALDLGACWLGVHPRQDRIDGLREVLRLPAQIVPVSCVALGYPAENKPPRTRYVEQYVHRDTW